MENIFVTVFCLDRIEKIPGIQMRFLVAGKIDESYSDAPSGNEFMERGIKVRLQGLTRRTEVIREDDHFVPAGAAGRGIITCSIESARSGCEQLISTPMSHGSSVEV